MCHFPSWYEKPDGTAVFLTDKDMGLIDVPSDYDCVGHAAIRTLYPGIEKEAQEKEGLPCHPDIVRAIQTGKMRKLMKLGGYEQVTIRKNYYESVSSDGLWETCEYKDDTLHGHYERVKSDGSWVTCEYKDDTRHGHYESVSSDGGWRACEYKDGKRHGHYERVKSDGSWVTCEYKYDKCVVGSNKCG